jgi:hypothetical protein
MNGGAHVGLPNSHSNQQQQQQQQQPVALTQQAIAHVQRRSVQGIPPRRQSGSAAQQPLQQRRQSGVAAPDVSHLIGRTSKEQQQHEIDYEPVLQRAPIAMPPRRSSQSYADVDATAAADSGYARNAYATEPEYRDQAAYIQQQQQQQQQQYHSEHRRSTHDGEESRHGGVAVVPAAVPGLRYTPQVYSSDSSAANSARSGTFARAGAASVSSYANEQQQSSSAGCSARRSSSDHHCRDEAALAEMRYSQQSYQHVRDKARATTQLW